MTNRLFMALVAMLCVGLLACGESKKPPRMEREEASMSEESSSSSSESTEAAATEEAVVPPMSASGGLKINECTVDDLVAAKIPRLGPALAQKIVDYRDANGPFKSMADIDNVPGVGEAMMASLEGKLDFGAAGAAGAAAPAAAGTAAAPASGEAAPAAGAAAPAAAPAAASGPKVNINTATAAQLQTLNGIGPSTAEAIVQYRTQHGKFKSIDELDNVPRIGPATIEKFRAQATI